jgi:hypothetical protein
MLSGNQKKIPSSMNTPVTESAQPVPPKAVNLGSVLWESAAASFVEAILVIIFGSLAIGLAGGLLREMIPSLPPGLDPRLEAEPKPVHGWNSSWSFLKAHQFPIVFAVLLILNVRDRLIGPAKDRGEGKPGRPTRAQKIGRRLAKDWFDLIVGNAFGAVLLAILFVAVQQFSWTRFFFDWVWGWIMPAIHTIAAAVFGRARIDSVDAWFHWYGQNQFKFTFWFFYWAAICDDLGVPNLKTLARWLWRRFRQRPLQNPSGSPA